MRRTAVRLPAVRSRSAKYFLPSGVSLRANHRRERKIGGSGCRSRRVDRARGTRPLAQQNSARWRKPRFRPLSRRAVSRERGEAAEPRTVRRLLRGVPASRLSTRPRHTLSAHTSGGGSRCGCAEVGGEQAASSSATTGSTSSSSGSAEDLAKLALDPRSIRVRPFAGSSSPSSPRAARRRRAVEPLTTPRGRGGAGGEQSGGGTPPPCRAPRTPPRRDPTDLQARPAFAYPEGSVEASTNHSRSGSRPAYRYPAHERFGVHRLKTISPSFRRRHAPLVEDRNAQDTRMSAGRIRGCRREAPSPTRVSAPRRGTAVNSGLEDEE